MRAPFSLSLSLSVCWSLILSKVTSLQLYKYSPPRLDSSLLFLAVRVYVVLFSPLLSFKILPLKDEEEKEKKKKREKDEDCCRLWFVRVLTGATFRSTIDCSNGSREATT